MQQKIQDQGGSEMNTKRLEYNLKNIDKLSPTQLAKTLREMQKDKKFNEEVREFIRKHTGGLK